MNAQTAQPTPIQIERRFPLDLHASLAPIRQLYEQGKAARWNPGTDIEWSRFDARGADASARASAARVWSRRAWIEYTGLSATPALLIRFCLELDRESDPKYFLTVRNTEEAWHVEGFHRYALACGQYHERPDDPAWEAVFNQKLDRDALNGSRSLDAYVATHCAYVDGLEHVLARGWLAHASEPVARRLLELCEADYDRHQRFGWLYLERRLADIDAAGRAALGETVAEHIRNVEFAGYHCVSVAASIDVARDRDDLDRTAGAGLGALPAEAETQVFVDHLADARNRFARLGVTLPALEHPLLGRL